MQEFPILPFVKHVRELYRTSGGARSTGWMKDEPAFLLYAFVKFFKPELVIQTGHLWGKSAAMVLEAMNDGFLGVAGGIDEVMQKADPRVAEFMLAHAPRTGGPAKCISIDPSPKHVPHSAEGVAYLKRLHPNFEFREMRSIEFFEQEGERLKHDYAGKRILGIVDGDHSWGGCIYDMESLADLGAQMIIVDDSLWLPHLGRAVHEFAQNHPEYHLLNLTLYTGTAIFWKRDFRVGPPKREVLGWTVHEVLYVIGGMRLVHAARRVHRALGRLFGG